MDAQQFLAEFRHIARAPGGVARLRELVLALAVQGRLVLQDESEEPAAKQLERIKTIALARSVSGRRKKSASIGRFDEAAIPDLPRGWASARLCDLVRVLNGRAYAKQELLESGTPVLRVGNLFTSDHWYYSNLELEDDKYCGAGDLLYAWSASFGPFIWQGERVIYHYHIWKLDLFSSKEVEKRFLYIWLLEKTQEIKSAGHGISMAHMTKEKFEQLVIALPPLKEQSRIVAKVDELLALCDQLETQQNGGRKLQNALRQSTLQALASAQSQNELQESWMRIDANLHQLFSSPEDVRALRRLIHELAVQGLLTRQTDTDVSAEEQLSEIRRLSSQVTNAGRRRKNVPYRAVGEGELGYKLPKGWALARLGELVRVLNGRAYSKSELLQSGTPVLRVGNLFTSKTWYYSNLELEEEKYCDAGDLLYAWSASFGQFIWAGPKVIFHYHIWKIDLFSEENLSKDFLYLVLQERTEAIKSAGHGISMAHMTKEKMEQLSVALPPLSEQHRIVARVSELMRNCDEIEQHLRDSEKIAERLAASAVAALTGITIEQEGKGAVKAPQTELIAPLRLGIPPDVKAQAPLASLLARNNGEMSARDLWQRFGGEIDAFYAQLKTEVAHGWIDDPTYVLDKKAPDGPKKYPNGAQVAKVKVKEEA